MFKTLPIGTALLKMDFLFGDHEEVETVTPWRVWFWQNRRGYIVKNGEYFSSSLIS
jgi:hypothetical protein